MDGVSEVKGAGVPDALQLAMERTYLAQERSMMAWIRTATSLITFGLAYYKFFMYLHELGTTKPLHHFLAPRTFGMMMIGIGVFSLAIATVQHRQQLKKLKREYAEMPWSVSVYAAGLISIVGICAFLEAIVP